MEAKEQASGDSGGHTPRMTVASAAHVAKNRRSPFLTEEFFGKSANGCEAAEVHLVGTHPGVGALRQDSVSGGAARGQVTRHNRYEGAVQSQTARCLEPDAAGTGARDEVVVAPQISPHQHLEGRGLAVEPLPERASVSLRSDLLGEGQPGVSVGDPVVEHAARKREEVGGGS